MDDANIIPQSVDIHLDESRTSLDPDCASAAQKMGQSRLAQSLKDYDSKTPEEVADILQQWQEVEEQYIRKTADLKQLESEDIRLRHTYIFHQASYALIVDRIPSTLDLGRSPLKQLRTLHRTLEHDSKASQATWKIYETRMKIHQIYDAIEKYIAFREEYFILEQSDQNHLDERKVATAAGRQETIEFGSALIRIRQELLE